MATLSGRSAAVLGAVMGAALLLLLGLFALLQEEIRTQQRHYATQQLRSLQQELAAAAPLPAPHPLSVQLPASDLRELYPLYERQRLAAVLIVADARTGYQGRIALLLGVARPVEGSVPRPRLRVLQHQETPGLADFLNDRPEAAYDGVSGASISATALTRTAEEVTQWLARCLNWAAVPGMPLRNAACSP